MAPSGVYWDVEAEPDRLLDDFELRLLKLIATGASVQRVARTLAISESTLRRKLAVVSRKLGASGRTNTVYLAAKKGLI